MKIQIKNNSLLNLSPDHVLLPKELVSNLVFRTGGNLQLQVRDCGVIVPFKKMSSILSVLPKISCPCFSKFKGLTLIWWPRLCLTHHPDSFSLSFPCQQFFSPPLVHSCPVLHLALFSVGACLLEPWSTHPLSGYISQVPAGSPKLGHTALSRGSATRPVIFSSALLLLMGSKEASF